MTFIVDKLSVIFKGWAFWWIGSFDILVNKFVVRPVRQFLKLPVNMGS